MSTEATGNGQPAVAHEPGQATAPGENEEVGEPSATAEVTESSEAPEASETDESGEASGDDEAAVDSEDFGDEEASEDDDEVMALDEYDLGADGEEDAVSGSLLELAEPVEFDDPIAVPPARRWPRVLLALGFVVIAAAIVGGAIAIVGSVTHGFKKPVKVTYKKAAVFSLRTGDCFDPQGQSYTLVSCDSPHVGEVFATFTLAGEKWPGNSAVAAAASSGCATRLPGYLNPQLALSLASTYVYPDSTAWQAGTRTVICEVRAPSGDITGSVRGAGATSG